MAIYKCKVVGTESSIVKNLPNSSFLIPLAPWMLLLFHTLKHPNMRLTIDGACAK